MKKLSILSALMLAVAAMGFAGCEANQNRERGTEFEEPMQERGTQPVQPGEEERTGFGQEEDRSVLEEGRQGGERMMDESQQEWNENVEQPVERELNE